MPLSHDLIDEQLATLRAQFDTAKAVELKQAERHTRATAKVDELSTKILAWEGIKYAVTGQK